MTSQKRAEQITKLLKEALDAQLHCKQINGKHGFNMKSLPILDRLHTQIGKAFAELSKSVDKGPHSRDEEQIANEVYQSMEDDRIEREYGPNY